MQSLLKKDTKVKLAGGREGEWSIVWDQKHTKNKTKKTPNTSTGENIIKYDEKNMYLILRSLVKGLI